MSLFACEQCGCVENTATGEYWGREKKLCSECGRGAWHGIFPKRMPGECGYEVGPNGFLQPPGGWPKPGQVPQPGDETQSHS